MNTQRVKVLLIEDSPDDIRLIEQMLSEKGAVTFDLSVVDRLAAARQYLSQHAVDVILLDLFLPDSFGLNTLTEIKAIVPNIATIALTIFDDYQLGVEAVNNGAQDCLVKERLESELLTRAIRHSVERARGAQNLLENERKFRSVIEQLANGMVLVDEEGLIVEWNTAQEKITKLARADAIARPIWEVQWQLLPAHRQSPDQLQALKQRFDAFLKSGQPPLLGSEIQHRLGMIRMIQSSVSPIQTDKGFMASILTRDVTEQRRAQEALEESFLFLQYSLDALSAHIAILDETGTIIAVNEPWRQFANNNSLDDPAYCLGTNYLEVCEATTGPASEMAQSVAREIRDAMAGSNNEFYLEYACHSPLEQRWFAVRLHSFELTGAQHVVVEHHNITERKLAEEALAAERSLLRTVIDHMPDPVYAKHRDGRYIFKNIADVRQVGADTPESVINKTDYDYYPPELAARYEADDQTVIQSGQPLINQEEPGITINGEQRWYLTTKVPLRNIHQEIIGLVGIGRDITERKHTQEQIEKLNAEINALYSISKQLSQTLDLEIIYSALHNAIIGHMDCDGLYITSYTPDDQLSHCVWAWSDGKRLDTDLFPPVPLAKERKSNESAVIHTGEVLYLPDYQSQVNASQTFDDMQSDGNIPDTDGMPKDENLPQSAFFVPLKLEKRVIGVVQVLSYRLGAYSEDDLRFLEALAPQAATSIANALLYQQAQHEVHERERAEVALHELNESLENQIAGRTAELRESETRYRAIIEDQTDLICRSLPDTTITFVNDAYCRFFGISREQTLGHSFMHRVFEEDRAQWQQERATLTPTKSSVTIEHRLIAGDGRLHWVQWTNRLITSEEDGHEEIQSVGRDITRQKRAEEVLRQALSREMDVNEMRSRFISMASHDLRTPLAIIQASIEMIDQYGDRLSEERKRTKYTEIHRAIQQMVTLLDNILIIGRANADNQGINPEPLDLILFCQNLLTELKTAFGPNHRLSLTTTGECEGLWLDSRLLRHIIENLVSNAIKYSPSHSTVKIDLKCAEKQIILSVEDRGIGIPVNDQTHLFENFFRASNVGKVPGTGLGLTIVRQSVELHGGSITFESRPEEGTTFFVVLPSIPMEEKHNQDDTSR